MNASGKIIRVLVRHAETGLLEERDQYYEGSVPPAVWLRLARRIVRLESGGYFFPLDAMDAYQQIFAKLEEKSREDLDLASASLETYLTRALDKAILKFHRCHVAPIRAAYRCAAGMIAAEDREDADNDDEGIGEEELMETLAGIAGFETRRKAAAGAIGEIIEALDDPTIAQAFMAYVIADGNLYRTAALIHYSRSQFFRVWEKWLARARSAAEKIRFNKTLLDF